ncbi:hypothetical protein INT45_007819 [Circinella minor]|uniref:PX domain-containing protein n=1 Tax=Circinella minor TaxID=1195481 RepID=A0A8H7V9T6_9FUNG|nr:hypothetical protein INT45_007819 [Circinella minor]
MDNSTGLQYDDALMGNPFADVVSPSRETEGETSIQKKEPEQEEEEEEEEATTNITHDEEYQKDRKEQKDTIPITTSTYSSSPTSSIHHNEDLNQDKNNIVENMASLNVENQVPITIPDVPSTMDNGSEYSQSESLEIPKSGSRPYFHVTVQDPQKVGDAINAHIVYKVKTKTNSPVFRTPEFVVARRYRDFLWLYNQLTLGNPGVIVPPVPEKHALGKKEF